MTYPIAETRSLIGMIKDRAEVDFKIFEKKQKIRTADVILVEETWVKTGLGGRPSISR